VAHEAAARSETGRMSALDASYLECQRISRRSASSFYYSFLLLPKARRRAMCALYAFLRRTDDLSDSQQPIGARRDALVAWRSSLHRALEGNFDDPLLPALADTVATYQIPLGYLDAVLDGVEMDLDVFRYATFADLEQYCYRVASVVGLACLRIWGCTSPEADWPSRQCGVAFQMTNILRDLAEDGARDRIYLPLEDLHRFNYTEQDLQLRVRDERFQALLDFEIARTEAFYREGEQLERWLDPQARRVFGSMLAVYRALLREIKRSDGDILSRRVRLTRWHKMRIATRWLLLPARKPAAAGLGSS
jgi:phytoene synthase